MFSTIRRLPLVHARSHMVTGASLQVAPAHCSCKSGHNMLRAMSCGKSHNKRGYSSMYEPRLMFWQPAYEPRSITSWGCRLFVCLLSFSKKQATLHRRIRNVFFALNGARLSIGGLVHGFAWVQAWDSPSGAQNLTEASTVAEQQPRSCDLGHHIGQHKSPMQDNGERLFVFHLHRLICQTNLKSLEEAHVRESTLGLMLFSFLAAWRGTRPEAIQKAAGPRLKARTENLASLR